MMDILKMASSDWLAQFAMARKQEKVKGYILLAGYNRGFPWLVGGIT